MKIKPKYSIVYVKGTASSKKIKEVVKMKRTLKWILLVWTVISLPYFLFSTYNPYTIFFGLVYAGLIIGLMVDDLKKGVKDK